MLTEETFYYSSIPIESIKTFFKIVDTFEGIQRVAFGDDLSKKLRIKSDFCSVFKFFK